MRLWKKRAYRRRVLFSVTNTWVSLTRMCYRDISCQHTERVREHFDLHDTHRTKFGDLEITF